jgi:hypothetical protein
LKLNFPENPEETSMLKPTPVTDQRQISTVERQRIIDKAFNDAMRRVSAKLAAAK